MNDGFTRHPYRDFRERVDELTSKTSNGIPLLLTINRTNVSILAILDAIDAGALREATRDDLLPRLAQIRLTRSMFDLARKRAELFSAGVAGLASSSAIAAWITASLGNQYGLLGVIALLPIAAVIIKTKLIIADGAELARQLDALIARMEKRADQLSEESVSPMRVSSVLPEISDAVESHYSVASGQKREER